MNNDTPNHVKRHTNSFFNAQISRPNFHAPGPQLPYADSLERSMFDNAGDFPNMDPRLTNLMANHVSGSIIGKQLNEAAGIRTTGHLRHPNSLHNGGPGNLSVQGANIPMKALIAQGLLHRQHVGMYHQNQNLSIQQEDFLGLPAFRGSTMSYPVDMHPKEQLPAYTLSQLQPQHLLGGQSAGFNLANAYLPHHQQQLSAAISGAGIGMLQANNDHRLRSHVTDQPSMVPSYHSTVPSLIYSNSSAHNMELGAAGLKPLYPMGTGGGPYDEALRQYELHNLSHLTQLQVQQMQAANTFNNQGRKQKGPTQLPVDPYGMLDLLRVMKPSRPSTVSAHGLGVDLTTLGLNLTQPDDLHKDFFSPFSDMSVQDVQDVQFMAPECYKAKLATDLQPSWFSRFHLGLLFYIFYSMPKDVAQLYAAHELMNREWLYHKEHRLWLIRDKKRDPLVKTDTYERGAFIFFDPNEWKVISQDNFVLKYDLIEDRPALP